MFDKRQEHKYCHQQPGKIQGEMVRESGGYWIAGRMGEVVGRVGEMVRESGG